MSKKSILILKTSKDICGNEIGLINNQCKLLGMNVVVEDVNFIDVFPTEAIKHIESGRKFDYLYLCTHGNIEGFTVDNASSEELLYPWHFFAKYICENQLLNEDGIILLACCKGGLFRVATDLMAVCNKINFVCGVKWNVMPWDLTTGFIVFIHNIETKRAEPIYAAQKASQATDYTFVCYDRDEISCNQNYENRRTDLFIAIGWMNDEGEWIESDPLISEFAGEIPATSIQIEPAYKPHFAPPDTETMPLRQPFLG